jgi:O-antigen/teichoic acid export membrane protein
LIQPNMQGSEAAAPSAAAAPAIPPKPLAAPGAPAIGRGRLVHWAQKGGFAILDQALISGSNFLISVLLARWLVPEQYGAYAVAFGVFVLLSLVYSALVLEPMAVFGGSSYHDCLRGYLRSLLWIHVTISLSIVIVLGVSAVVARQFYHSPVLAGALAGVSLASPCVLFFWLARRTFYLQLSASRAALGAFVYFALSMGALFLVYHRHLLSPFSAFVVMGLAALGTGLYNLLRLRAGLRPDACPPPAVQESWGRHWGYGRWALASCVVNWIPAYIYFPLLSWFVGMAASGQLRALMNFTQPLEQIKAALSLLFLPYAANVFARKGPSSAGTLGTRMTLVALGFGGAYWMAVLVFRQPVFHFLYSGKYAEVAHLLPIVAFGSIVWSMCFGPAMALRAMQSPASVFTAYSLATFLSLLIGIPITWRFGLTGAIWGGNIADVFSWVAVLAVLRRKVASYSAAADQITVWTRPPQALPEQFPLE